MFERNKIGIIFEREGEDFIYFINDVFCVWIVEYYL